ncbi:hypothetical protein HK100_000908 [Physocladia obscura]|uniref:TFIIS N-terminal domain-containing protein n=1 Tax=Physocladia obscura TaxID=109957 RepID=A0AAD5T8M4_9FUNG|nr:hypothetical protein HK100_000908 [Physocladia obscura]
MQDTQEEGFQREVSVTSDESGDVGSINKNTKMDYVSEVADRNSSVSTEIDDNSSNVIDIEDTTPPPQSPYHSEVSVVSTPTPPATPAPPPTPMTLADINFEDPNYVVKYLKFLAAAETVEEKRARIRADGYQVSDSFYEGLALLKSFKSLIFFRQWVVEAKDAGQTGLLKDVLNLLVKLPISLEGLVASKLGRAVKVVMSGGDGVDEDVKQIAKKLTTAWAALVQKSSGNSAGDENALAKQHPLKTLAERQQAQRERENAIAAASAAKAQELQELLAKAKQNAPQSSSSTTQQDESSTFDSVSAGGEARYPAFSYRRAKVALPEVTDSAATMVEEKNQENEDDVKAAGGVKSILSNTVMPDVDPANPRRKRKSVSFSADLVKTRFFNSDEEAAGVAQDWTNRSARESEKQEGRKAFHREGDDRNSIQAKNRWKNPKGLMRVSGYLQAKETAETKIQEERERGILSVSYYVDEDIPATPGEPDEVFKNSNDAMDESNGGSSNAAAQVPVIPLDDPEVATPVQTALVPTTTTASSNFLGTFSSNTSNGLSGLLSNFGVVSASNVGGGGVGLTGLGGLGTLLGQAQQQQQGVFGQTTPGLAGLGIGGLGGLTATAPSAPVVSGGVQGLLASLQQQQQQQPATTTVAKSQDVSSLLKSLGVFGGIPTTSAPSTTSTSVVSAAPSLPAFLQQQQQQSQVQAQPLPLNALLNRPGMPVLSTPSLPTSEAVNAFLQNFGVTVPTNHQLQLSPAPLSSSLLPGGAGSGGGAPSMAAFLQMIQNSNNNNINKYNNIKNNSGSASAGSRLLPPPSLASLPFGIQPPPPPPPLPSDKKHLRTEDEIDETRNKRVAEVGNPGQQQQSQRYAGSFQTFEQYEEQQRQQQHNQNTSSYSNWRGRGGPRGGARGARGGGRSAGNNGIIKPRGSCAYWKMGTCKHGKNFKAMCMKKKGLTEVFKGTCCLQN